MNMAILLLVPMIVFACSSPSQAQATLTLAQCQALGITDRIRNCTSCPDCYTCLSSLTGDDNSGCTSDDLTRDLQCMSQVDYIFRNSSLGLPCQLECDACVDDWDVASGLGLPDYQDLDSSLWEELFEEMFVPSDTQGAFDIYSEPYLDHVTRRKRDSDMDECCNTQRDTVPYISSISDGVSSVSVLSSDVITLRKRSAETIEQSFSSSFDALTSGDTWYSVWLHTFAQGSPTYSYQFYDVITCPTSVATCDSDIQCLLRSAPRTFLMTTTAPHPLFGHSMVILTYPNDNVRLITINTPSYCRCTM